MPCLILCLNAALLFSSWSNNEDLYLFRKRSCFLYDLDWWKKRRRKKWNEEDDDEDNPLNLKLASTLSQFNLLWQLHFARGKKESDFLSCLASSSLSSRFLRFAIFVFFVSPTNWHFFDWDLWLNASHRRSRQMLGIVDFSGNMLGSVLCLRKVFFKSTMQCGVCVMRRKNSNFCPVIAVNEEICAHRNNNNDAFDSFWKKSWSSGANPIIKVP